VKAMLHQQMRLKMDGVAVFESACVPEKVDRLLCPL